VTKWSPLENPPPSGLKEFAREFVNSWPSTAR
jgi:hypothetical protein